MTDHINQSPAHTAPRTGPSRIVVVIAAAAILGVMFLVVWLQSSKYEPLVVGKEAPDFQLPDLNEKQLRLSDYRGKVVFLNFWATWCKPCREEMPSMEVLYKNFEKDGLVILAVSIDRVTTKKEIPPFVKGLNLTFPVLVDSWGQTDKRYKLMGVPETYIIDQQGVLREKVIGPRDWTRLDNLKVLTQLLKPAEKAAHATPAQALPMCNGNDETLFNNIYGRCGHDALWRVFCRRSRALPASPAVPMLVVERIPQVDEEAPNFLLRDSEGFNVTLDQFRGKVVLLNFWATWCGPCKIEMPAMERLYRSFSRKDFEILAVSTDAQGAAVTRPFQREVGFTFPVLHDADFRIGLQYGARQLPMTFLIDRKGIIRNRIPGARDWSAPAGKRLVESLLQGS
jgi:cytochrome c biogenesis protein CcmG/thiol:disulfide interchange protein DsbE